MRILLAAALIGAALPCLAQAPAPAASEATPAPHASAGAPAFDPYGESEDSRRWKARVDSLVASICASCGQPARRPPPRRGGTASPEEDAVARALADETLRPGDVVMLPDGPKVFRGGPEPFAPATIGVAKQPPAKEPRRARASPSAPDREISATREGATQPRVVYPGPIPR